MEDRLTVKASGVLIHRRAADDVAWLLLRNARAGHWGFAKGHLEPSEEELSGALREVREETGLLPRLDPAFREELRYALPAGKHAGEVKSVVYYLGSVKSADVVTPSPEHDRVEWCDLERARHLLEHEQLRELLTRADRFVRRGR